MLTGRSFEITSSTIAIETIEGRRTAITIPMGAHVKVVSDTRDGDRMIDVLYEGQIVAIFLIDLENRGKDLGADRVPGA